MLRTTCFAAALAVLPLAAAAQSGSFVGQSDHDASGSVEIVTEDGAQYIVFGDDFRLDRAPDPQVALGRDGYDAATLAGELDRRRGGQRYRVPDGIDAADYDQVWIWCVRFDVPLALAELAE